VKAGDAEQIGDNAVPNTNYITNTENSVARLTGTAESNLIIWQLDK